MDMKNISKTIISLLLIIVFLFACIFILIGGAVGLWLRTYNVFTEETPVAEVVISEQKEDELGPYVDVQITQIKRQSALASLISEGEGNPEKEETQTYKLYGDVVHLGGPIVKFKNSLILFDFKTVYKLAKLYARYDLDNDLERNRTPEMASSYDLNGGIKGWKRVHDRYTADNLVGSVYRVFIDTTEISTPGIYVSNKELKYTLVTTNFGFKWRLNRD